MLPTDKKARKERPIARGVLDYFPDAIAEVARTSYVGNQQHNPGEVMHWAREKSTDHADCVVRHLMERGKLDTDGIPHMAKAAWRCLAALQLEMEKGYGVPMGVSLYDGGNIENGVYEEREPETHAVPAFRSLTDLGCSRVAASAICGGISYAPLTNRKNQFVYVAGPMRGIKDFNFPQFDAARDFFLSQGYNVISPADIDRAAGDVPDSDQQYADSAATYLYRDFYAIFLMTKEGHRGDNAVAFLPGWEKSTGAFAEFAIARWLGLRVLDATTGKPLEAFDVDMRKIETCIARFLTDQLTKNV